MALQLNHPKRLLELFTKVLSLPPADKDDGSLTGKTAVDEVLCTLGDEQLWKLVCRLRDWNANARTARVAQRVLFVLLHLYPKEKFVALRKRRGRKQEDQGGAEELADGVAGMALEDNGKRGAGRNESVKDVIDGLKAYTERHKQRVEKMAMERHVLVWTLQCMDEGVGDEGMGMELVGV